MPKIKTHKGAQKRIKTTGSGKLLRRKAYSGHNLSKKRPSRKRSYSKEHEVHSTQTRNVKRGLGQ